MHDFCLLLHYQWGSSLASSTTCLTSLSSHASTIHSGRPSTNRFTRLLIKSRLLEDAHAVCYVQRARYELSTMLSLMCLHAGRGRLPALPIRTPWTEDGDQDPGKHITTIIFTAQTMHDQDQSLGSWRFSRPATAGRTLYFGL